MYIKNIPNHLLIALLLIIIPVFSVPTSSDYPRVMVSIIDDKNSEKREKELWFAAFAQNYIKFRIGVSSKFDLISQKEIANCLDTSYNSSSEVLQKRAKEINADKILIQNFYFEPIGNKVNYYAEIYTKETWNKPASYEKTLSLDNIAKELDSIAEWFLSICGLMDGVPEISRFFPMRIVPDDIREIKKTGEILSIPSNSPKINVLTAISALHDAVARDQKNLLASFAAAQLYEKIGQYAKAAKEQNDLLIILPFYASLYSHVVKNYRIIGHGKKALTFAANAEKKGVVTRSLLLEGAITLEKLGIYRQASRAFYDILQNNSKEVRALLYFARLGNRENQPEIALKYCDSILTIDSLYGEAFLESGRALIKLKKYKLAEKFLTMASANLSSPDEAYILLGEVAYTLSEYQKSALFYENAIKTGQKFAIAFLKASKSWLKDNKPEKSYALLQKAYSLFPKNGDILKSFALISFLLKDSTEAIELLEKYTTNFKLLPEILYPMGDIYTAKGNYKRAFFAYNHAKNISTDTSYANLKLGMLYLKKGDFTISEKLLSQRVKDYPNDGEAYLYLGDLFQKNDNSSKALKMYLKSRELNISKTYCSEQIALINFDNKNYKTAKAEFEKLKNISNSIQDLNYKLAASSLHLKDINDAKKYLEIAMNHEIPSAEILIDIASGYEDFGNLKISLKILRNAAIKFNGTPKIFIKLAALLDKMELYEEEAINLTKLYNIDNSRYGMHYAKAGFLFEKSNNVERAYSIYNDFLNKGFKSDEVNKHLAGIEYKKGNFAKTVELLSDPELTLRKINNKQFYGEAMFFLGDYGKALPYLIEVASIKTSCAECQANLAATYEIINEIDSAIEYYEKAITLASDNKANEFGFRIASIYQKNNFDNLAIKTFRKNILSYPKDRRNYNSLISIYSNQRDWLKVESILQELLSSKNSNPFDLKRLAEIEKKQNDRSREETTLKEYLKINSEDDEAFVSLATNYFDRNLFSDATEFFDKAINIRTQSDEIIYKAAISNKNIKNETRAINLFENILSSKKLYSEVLNQLTNCYRDVKDSVKLKESLNTKIFNNPNDYTSLLELGIIYKAEGDIENAVSAFNRAIHIDTDNSMAHLQLSIVYEKNEEFELQLDHLKKALAKRNDNIKTLTYLGKYFRVHNSPEKAIVYINKALSINPEYGEALYEKGLYNFRNNDIKNAYTNIAIAVEKVPYLPGIYTIYALILNSMERKKEAIKYINRAIAFDSSDVRARISAAKIYHKANADSIAKEHLIKALTLKKNSDECFTMLGDIYIKESQASKAVGFYRKAIEITGYNRDLMLKLAKSLRITYQLMAAERTALTILKNEKYDPEVRYYLIEICILNNDIELAKRYAKKYRPHDDKVFWDHLSDAIIARSNGDFEIAKIAYTVASKLGKNRNACETKIGMALIELDNKNYKKAITIFESAININPHDPYLLLNLGKSYEGFGDFSTALDIYRKLSDKYSEIPDTYRLIAGLRSREAKHESAVAMIQKGLNIDPKNSKLYLALGRELKATGAIEKSIDAYKQSLKYSTDILALIELAEILYKDKNDQKNATKYLKKYIKYGGSRDSVVKAGLEKVL